MPTKKKSSKKAAKTSSRTERPIEVISSLDMPTYYSNRQEVRRSAIDFDLRFGEILRADEEKMVVKELCHVYLSPSSAKAFAALMSRTVAEYEETVGEITDFDALAKQKLQSESN